MKETIYVSVLDHIDALEKRVAELESKEKLLLKRIEQVTAERDRDYP